MAFIRSMLLLLVLLFVLTTAAMAQTTPADIAGALCADNGSLLRNIVTWAFNAMGVMGIGAVASNSKTLQGVPYLGPVVNIIGANWAKWLREAAAGARKPTGPN